MAVQMLNTVLVMKPKRSHLIKSAPIEEAVDSMVDNVYGEQRPDRFEFIVNYYNPEGVEAEEITSIRDVDVEGQALLIQADVAEEPLHPQMLECITQEILISIQPITGLHLLIIIKTQYNFLT